jgi:hypothetical protein
VLREEIDHPHQSNACLDLNQRFGSVLFAICLGFDPNQQKRRVLLDHSQNIHPGSIFPGGV